MWSFKPKRKNANVPAWVSRLSDEEDRKILKLMVDNGADLNKPREMIFCMKAKAENTTTIQTEAELLGWKCIIGASVDPKAGKLDQAIDLIKDGYVITLDNFERDSLIFERLAKKYNSECDGWYASIAPNE